MLIDIIVELINDINLNTKTEDGTTALHYLCENSEKRIELFYILKLFTVSRKVGDLNAIGVDRKTHFTYEFIRMSSEFNPEHRNRKERMFYSTDWNSYFYPYIRKK